LTERLIAASARVTDWDTLLQEAEEQGVAPLLSWYLQDLPEVAPDHFRRGLRLLYLRHRHINAVLLKTLDEVIGLLTDAGIVVLALKGAALSLTIYPEMALRPMRDIDLLVRPEQAWAAQNLLVQHGFTAATGPRPADHFHLPSLHLAVDSIPVCIELHHGFFPNCPPFYRKPDFDSLLQTALSFALPSRMAWCLGPEDMLWHVFHHGFHPPLSYEPFKLIAVADVMLLVEKYQDDIDWDRMRKMEPGLCAALPLFHALTPWGEKEVTRFAWRLEEKLPGAGEPFQGWPRRHLKEWKGESLITMVRATFLPSSWWLHLYYGVNNPLSHLKARWVTHPLHILWWARLYASFLTPAIPPGQVMTPGQKIRRWGSAALKIIRSLFYH
jgi:hypothetical protein